MLHVCLKYFRTCFSAEPIASRGVDKHLLPPTILLLLANCIKLELATYLLSRLLYALFLPLRVRYNVIILLTVEISRSIPISVFSKKNYLLNITIDTFHEED